MTADTIQKAARLIADGKVHPAPSVGGGFTPFTVEGDTGTYYVTVRGLSALCGCKRGVVAVAAGDGEVKCSHAAAALFVAQGRRPPVGPVAA